MAAFLMLVALVVFEKTFVADSLTVFSFQATNTNNALQNYKEESFQVCGKITASMCASFGWGQGSCAGDTVMRIVDSNGVELALNDDYCGKCSQVSYTSSSGCTNVRLRFGCSGISSCSGLVEVDEAGPAPSMEEVCFI